MIQNSLKNSGVFVKSINNIFETLIPIIIRKNIRHSRTSNILRSRHSGRNDQNRDQAFQVAIAEWAVMTEAGEYWEAACCSTFAHSGLRDCVHQRACVTCPSACKPYIHIPPLYTANARSLNASYEPRRSSAHSPRAEDDRPARHKVARNLLKHFYIVEQIILRSIPEDLLCNLHNVIR